ncbi:MAG: DUF3857 domain-containing protein [Chitinophagaceae bacterium]
MKRTFFSLILCLFLSYAFGQQRDTIVLKKITEADFAINTGTGIDSGSAAIILADVGTVNYTDDKKMGSVAYVYSRRKRIKIIRSSAFNLAVVKISLFGKGSSQEELRDVQAFAFNMENGHLNITALDQSSIFENKQSSYQTIKQFAIPNVHEGTIIEFGYSVYSHLAGYLPKWNFQYEDYPVLFSQLRVNVPNMLTFRVIETGVDTARNATSENLYRTIQVGSLYVSGDYTRRTWTMNNVPAFRSEPFLNCPDDYLEGIQFRFEGRYDETDPYEAETWKSFNNELAVHPRFGRAVRPDYAGNLQNTMDKVCGNDNNPMDAAKHLYAYVRDNFTAFESENYLLSNDLYEINKNRKGNSADLNLLLVGLLQLRGLKASPVILATTEMGVPPKAHPNPDRLNHVICLLKIYGDSVYLDASKPKLAFGKLDLDCYNDFAWVISENESGPIVLSANSVKELNVTTVFVQADEKENNLMHVNLRSNPGYHASYSMRNEITSTDTKSFFAQVGRNCCVDCSIENIGIDSLLKLDVPVNLHVDYNFKTEDDMLYYNPVLLSHYTVNPFSATARHYPIDLPMAIDEMYVMNMEIPKGYAILEIPNSAKVSFNEGEGSYEYGIQHDETSIQLRIRLSLKRTKFNPDDYNSLRDFFAFVGKMQAKQFVFKKTK